MGSYLAHEPKIYHKAHENPKAFSCISGPIFFEPSIQCPWGVGLHQIGMCVKDFNNPLNQCWDVTMLILGLILVEPSIIIFANIVLSKSSINNGRWFMERGTDRGLSPPPPAPLLPCYFSCVCVCKINVVVLY